jgi:SecD/SecF fusion protein
LTILGYSLYDTIIVFDRIRENIPRMPRAAFSQIVNRSMSEVITRSLATTTCTLLPILALLFFGGSQLQDFAFALLIGVASGAYSSIFIASPVLTHWKERESLYRHRRDRIVADQGMVPAYAPTGSDVAPRDRARLRRSGGLQSADAGNVSAAEFEQMKRDIQEEETEPGGRTSVLTRRAAHTDEDALGEERASRRARRQRPARQQPAADQTPPAAEEEPAGEDGFEHAPDEVENEGMLPPDQRNQRGARSSRSSRRRGRGHGRR